MDVNKQLEELRTFFEQNKELDALLEKRIKLESVLHNLSQSITHLSTEPNAIVNCIYYNEYDDIGIDNKLEELKLPVVEKKFNIHIGFCERLINQIQEYIKSISKEDIDKISIGVKGYENSSNKLFKEISKIDNPNLNSFTSYLPYISRDSNTKKTLHSELLNYLKKLKYLFETTCEYKLINTTPIPNPHEEARLEEEKKLKAKKLEEEKLKAKTLVGAGSYKKTTKKNILEKERCIYKITGDRKEYIKYKGNFIAVRDYKKLMKSR